MAKSSIAWLITVLSCILCDSLYSVTLCGSTFPAAYAHTEPTDYRNSPASYVSGALDDSFQQPRTTSTATRSSDVSSLNGPTALPSIPGVYASSGIAILITSSHSGTSILAGPTILGGNTYSTTRIPKPVASGVSSTNEDNSLGLPASSGLTSSKLGQLNSPVTSSAGSRTTTATSPIGIPGTSASTSTLAQLSNTSTYMHPGLSFNTTQTSNSELNPDVTSNQHGRPSLTKPTPCVGFSKISQLPSRPSSMPSSPRTPGLKTSIGSQSLQTSESPPGSILESSAIQCGNRTITDSTIGTSEMSAGKLFCTPPCKLILPDFSLRTPTIVTLSPLTTTITQNVGTYSTNGGVAATRATDHNTEIVITSTISLPPETVSVMSFLPQPITECNQTTGTLVPQPIVAPSPVQWSSSISGGPMISTSIVLPPYIPTKSTCASYSDCPFPPLLVSICAPGNCPGGTESGGGGGAGECGSLCGRSCALPSFLEFLCNPLSLFGLIPGLPKCEGPICDIVPPCVGGGCWLSFPEAIDPNIQRPDQDGLPEGPSETSPGPRSTKTSSATDPTSVASRDSLAHSDITSDRQTRSADTSVHQTTSATRTPTSKSCTSTSIVTDYHFTCFTAGTISYCENATSFTQTGCNVTPASSTTFLACPALDADEPQGDTSMPASISSMLQSMLSNMTSVSRGATRSTSRPRIQSTSLSTHSTATESLSPAHRLPPSIQVATPTAATPLSSAPAHSPPSPTCELALTAIVEPTACPSGTTWSSTLVEKPPEFPLLFHTCFCLPPCEKICCGYWGHDVQNPSFTMTI